MDLCSKFCYANLDQQTTQRDMTPLCQAFYPRDLNDSFRVLFNNAGSKDTSLVG